MRVDRGQTKQTAHRVGGSDDGVGSGLTQQRKVLVLPAGDDDVAARVELSHRQCGEDGRVISVEGDDDLARLADLSSSQQIPPRRVAFEGSQA